MAYDDNNYDDDVHFTSIDEASAAEETPSGQLVIGEPEQEPLQPEEDVVDDFLTLENDGERLVLEGGDQQLVIADSEYHSKRDIREFESQVRCVLEAMVYEGRERLRREIAKERDAKVAEIALRVEKAEADVKRLTDVKNRQSVIYLVAPEPYSHSLDRKGWVVVDTTWERGPLHFSEEGGWLGTAGEEHGPTVFASKEDAQKAIESTKNLSGGKFAWSNNNYVAVSVN